MVSSVHVNTKTIVGLTLHKPRPLLSRLDLLPFAFLYILNTILTSFAEEDDRIYYLVALPAIMVLQGLTALAPHWSVAAKTIILFYPASDVASATHVRIFPAPNKGRPEIIPIQSVSASSSEPQRTFFSYQKRSFTFNSANATFEKPVLPTRSSLSTYLSSKGHESSSDRSLEALKNLHGLNVFDIPVPTFIDLYKEHAVAPFFVFQIFCVLLWCLDEYWYYSLFTLAMLLVLEATVVGQRLRTMSELRKMTVPPHELYVLRNGGWKKMSSKELLPGDIFSLTRSKEGQVCPCDAILLEGTAVVNEALLTGESIPQIKESLHKNSLSLTASILQSDQLHMKKEHKQQVLFGGTRILQHTMDKNERYLAGNYSTVLTLPPDGGCPAYVLRTGFDTTQGKLIRTILYANERMTANSKEALAFILILLVFGLAAAWHVLKIGLLDPERSRYKLALQCIMIVTSVVPPELPMELSLAVNASLVALSRLGVFCTEPFRIPVAGKVSVCCFDKTGTLQDDTMILLGIALAEDVEGKVPAEDGKQEKQKEKQEKKDSQDKKLTGQLSKAEDIPDEVSIALACCHQLVQVENEVVGDPMEKAALQGLDWTVSKDNDVVTLKAKKIAVRIHHRYAFNSTLKRMACIVQNTSASTQLYSVVKGAPEVMAPLFSSLPAGYEQAYRRHMRAGSRVIAFGYRTLDEASTVSEARALPRETIESNLRFGGLAVFSCPLKKDSLETVSALIRSYHTVLMITGDNALTACHVALELGIVSKPCLVLSTTPKNNTTLWWSDLDGHHIAPVTLISPTAAQDAATKKSLLAAEKKERSKLSKQYDFCVSGDALQVAINNDPDFLNRWITHVNIYARTSPEQKEEVVNSLKAAGYGTLMCGDGTNDVGALKQADVGVALLNRPEQAPAPPKKAAAGPVVAATGTAGAAAPSQAVTAAPGVPAVPRPKTPAEAREEARRQAMERMEKHPILKHFVESAKAAEQMQEAGAGPSVRLGDASFASPFTSKSGSVSSTLSIIRQGRCTLVTTIQMYKILALNCLISAYSLSALYMDGVKFGDGQMFINGILISVCFLFVSRARPLQELSTERPHTSIFSPYVLLSVFGQCTFHMATLVYLVHQAKAHEPLGKVELEAEFKPSLLNTVVFMVECAQQFATFFANYRGRPFMESMKENKPLHYCLIGLLTTALITSSEILPFFNNYMQLVPMPSTEFRNTLFGLLVADMLCSVFWEKLMLLIFQNKPPASSIRQQPKIAMKMEGFLEEDGSIVAADGRILIASPNPVVIPDEDESEEKGEGSGGAAAASSSSTAQPVVDEKQKEKEAAEKLVKSMQEAVEGLRQRKKEPVDSQ